MWQATLKAVAARRLRLALTISAIVLGVTFVVGALVLTDTANKLFADQFADANDGVDLVVRSAVAFDSGMGVEVERDPLPDGLPGEVRAIDGVVDAVGQVSGQALLFAPDGEPIVPDGPSVGGSWAPEPVGMFTMLRGRVPAGADEVVIDAATAAEHGFRPGATITVQTSGPPDAYRIVGIVGFGDRDTLPGATVALFDLATAQRAFEVDGLSQISVIAADDVDVTALRSRVGDALGPQVEVASNQDTAAAAADAARDQLGFLPIMLTLLAVTALLIGGFLIANTFAILIAQRTREFATLRAVGATGRQVTASVIGEAVVVGVVASALGTLLGIAAAEGLRALIGAFGVTLPDGPLVVAGRTLAAGLATGVTVTILSAVAPARRAARVAPVEALREAAATGDRQVGRARLAGGAASGAAAIVLLATSVTGVTPSLTAVAAAGVAATVALRLLTPTVAGRLAGALGRPLARRGVPGKLARSNARRTPRRTAATVTALALGLAVVTFMTVLGTSMKASMGAALDDVITADHIIESARSEMLGGLSHHVAHRVGDLPEVGTVSRLRYGHWRDGDTVEALAAVHPATLPEVVDLSIVDGSLAALAEGGVVLSDTVAAEHGVGVGDRLSMTFARTGRQGMRVVGIIANDDVQALQTGYLTSLDSYEQHFTEDVDAAVYVRGADGVEPAAVQRAIHHKLEEFPTAVVRDPQAAAQARMATVDNMLGLVTVLLLLAATIALLGITNTLALSILERRREVGLLRAVGATRGQIAAMVRWEAALVAVLGGVVGIALGVAFGWAAVGALGSRFNLALSLPGGRLLAYLAVAGVAGLLAGVLPARRAARLDVLGAIATE